MASRHTNEINTNISFRNSHKINEISINFNIPDLSMAQ